PAMESGSPGFTLAAKWSTSIRTATSCSWRSSSVLRSGRGSSGSRRPYLRSCGRPLGRHPQFLHLVQGHAGKSWRLLDLPEPLFELAVGFPQCLFWLDVEKACEV